MLKYILNLIKGRKVHVCIASIEATVRIKAKYVSTAKIMKGKMVLRYDVYCTRYCDICNKKMYTEKIHKNVTSGFLLTRFNIHV